MHAPSHAGALSSHARGLVVPLRPNSLQHVMAWAAFVVDGLVTATMRCKWSDQSGFGGSQRTQPVIFCLWHNRLAISMIVHQRHPRKLAALLSASKDGPKGPRYVVQKGVISLAQVTELPIIPVTCNTQRKICVKNWDGFQIPLPFFTLRADPQRPYSRPAQGVRDQEGKSLRAGTGRKPARRAQETERQSPPCRCCFRSALKTP